jgi:hypothetical protein
MSGTERPRRAVVTGGAGFLGSYVCDGLLRRGFEVVCLDNFLTGTAANLAHLLEDLRFRLIRADVTQYLYLAGSVGYVLHFASPASPADYLKMPIRTLKVGSIATLHALGLAREKTPGSSLPPPPRSTEIPRCTRSPRPTGAADSGGCTGRERTAHDCRTGHQPRNAAGTRNASTLVEGAVALSVTIPAGQHSACDQIKVEVQAAGGYRFRGR